MKATAVAPANIAFIKYWGKKDENLRLPENGSISMNLSNLHTTTAVEFSQYFTADSVEINKNKGEERRVINFINKIRKLAKISYKVKVISQNNFPTASGLASSASGFAALTLAATAAAGLHLSEKELSILARVGSGSACRSIPDGFVEWIEGNSNETSYAISLYTADYWDIVDIVVIVSEDEKDVSSTHGHEIATTSPFFQTRIAKIKEKIKKLKNFIKEKNFQKFGELIEAEALELHTIMLTSTPSLIYWHPATIKIMKEVKKLRQKDLPVYFTIDAGPHLHLICQKENTDKIAIKLKQFREINKIIVNYAAVGARLI